MVPGPPATSSMMHTVTAWSKEAGAASSGWRRPFPAHAHLRLKIVRRPHLHAKGGARGVGHPVKNQPAQHEGCVSGCKRTHGLFGRCKQQAGPQRHTPGAGPRTAAGRTGGRRQSRGRRAAGGPEGRSTAWTNRLSWLGTTMRAAWSCRREMSRVCGCTVCCILG